MRAVATAAEMPSGTGTAHATFDRDVVGVATKGPVCRKERGGHASADAGRRYTLSKRLYNTHSLHAQDHGQLRCHRIAIGAQQRLEEIHARALYPDENLAEARRPALGRSMHSSTLGSPKRLS